MLAELFRDGTTAVTAFSNSWDSRNSVLSASRATVKDLPIGLMKGNKNRVGRIKRERRKAEKETKQGELAVQAMQLAITKTTKKGCQGNNIRAQVTRGKSMNESESHESFRFTRA